VKCSCEVFEPDDSLLQKVISSVTEKYKLSNWTAPDDLFSRSHFNRVLEKIEMTSSPGLPLLHYAPTNGALLKNSDGSWNQSNCDLLWAMVQDNLVNKKADPIRIFIKPEPHKRQKIESKAYRLIMSVSLVDQVIDHMLFGEMNQKMIDVFGSIPSMVGWSYTHGGWRLIPPSNYGYDKSAWDMTKRSWLAKVNLEVRTNLCSNPNKQTLFGTWLEVASFRYEKLYSKVVFQLSNGKQFRQEQDGIMKSGSLNTISDNSMDQITVEETAARIVHEDPDDSAKSMGDDLTQSRLNSLEKMAVIRSMGIMIKDPIVGEFCGMIFKRDFTMEPAYFGKHMAQLRHLDEDVAVETLQSYQLLYARSSYLPRLREIISKTYPTAFVPDQELLDILL